MKKYLSKRMLTACAGLLLGMSTLGQAATVSLVPSATDVDNGDVLSLDLVLDATGAPGAVPGSFHGSVILDYDPGLVSFDDFTFNSPASELAIAPVTDGGSTVTLGFEGAPNVGVIGTFTFNVLGMDGDVLNFGLNDADDFFGSFANTLPTIQPVFPDFNGASVNVVPIPAAAWLFLSALGLAGTVARRRA